MPNDTLISLFIVDDDEDYCRVLEKGLAYIKNIVCIKTYRDCSVMLQALQVEKPVPQVILLDIQMPGFNGLDAITPIKRLSPETHIIILTGHEDEENIRKALKRGISGFLYKTSHLRNIIDSIEAVVRGEAPMDPLVVRKMLGMYGITDSPHNEYGLTERENDIILYASKGFTKNEIADKLYLSFHTVDTHFKNIFIKLNVHSNQALLAKIAKEKLI